MNTKFKNVLLALAAFELAVGLSGAQQNYFFYLGLPLSVSLFGLFLIVHTFEKESALYDEQNRSTVSVSKNFAKASTVPQEVAHHPDLTTAHPH